MRCITRLSQRRAAQGWASQQQLEYKVFGKHMGKHARGWRMHTILRTLSTSYLVLRVLSE